MTRLLCKKGSFTHTEFPTLTILVIQFGKSYEIWSVVNTSIAKKVSALYSMFDNQVMVFQVHRTECVWKTHLQIRMETMCIYL